MNTNCPKCGGFGIVYVPETKHKRNKDGSTTAYVIYATERCPCQFLPKTKLTND